MHATNDSDSVVNISDIYNLSHDELSQNFKKTDIKEVEPTTQNINKNICEENLSIVIDELVNLYFKMANEGKEESVSKQYVLDYINNHKINLREIYHWLLNNPNDSNSIYLLGYFSYYGIGTDIDTQKAFELYQKGANLGNSISQYNVALVYEFGKGIGKDLDLEIYWYKKSADQG
ncbi:hypothetical protein C1646_766345 [Rhizophagus diaphanus]|nr:hypothetical protein C1646_766345 [Rhizophagus diaphanus] [Rhizophagus sp. MUCL 43196]